MTEDPPQRPRWATALLVALPLWLLLSGGFALWYYFRLEKKQALVEQERFARTVSAPMLEDDLKKLVEVIGERHPGSESAAKNLGRTASMIEGLLGPSNTGYTVRREQGPGDWPLLQVTLRGKRPEAPALWVVSSYDSRPGSPGVEANATGLAATLAAAQAIAGDQPDITIHFAFLPHANDPDSPVLETATRLKELAGTPLALLCVEAMGGGAELWLSSRDTEATPLSRIHGLGKVRGAEVVCLGGDEDLASILFEMGLPAVRVATRSTVTAGEPDDQLPPAATTAAAAGRLIELIRRCTAAPDAR
jgi:hypothetical protein